MVGPGAASSSPSRITPVPVVPAESGRGLRPLDASSPEPDSNRLTASVDVVPLKVSDKVRVDGVARYTEDFGDLFVGTARGNQFKNLLLPDASTNAA